MHRLEAGDDELDAFEELLRSRNARIGVVGSGLRWRQRTIDFPREWDAVRVILGEEVVEDRRAGTGLSDDHDRRYDVDLGDLGVTLAPLDDAESGREVVGELAHGDLLTELVQSAFAA